MSTYRLAFVSIRILSIFLFATLLPASFALLTVIWETGHPGTISGLIAQALFYLLIPAAIWINAGSLARRCFPDDEFSEEITPSLDQSKVLVLALIIIGIVLITDGLPGGIGHIVQMFVQQRGPTGDTGRFVGEVVEILLGIILLGNADTLPKVFMKDEEKTDLV